MVVMAGIVSHSPPRRYVEVLIPVPQGGLVGNRVVAVSSDAVIPE